jgi:hypothetical protein
LCIDCQKFIRIFIKIQLAVRQTDIVDSFDSVEGILAFGTFFDTQRSFVVEKGLV